LPYAIGAKYAHLAMGGAPKFEESQSLPEVSYADVARTMGLKAIAVDDPDAVRPAWDEALAAREPVVLDMRTDPEVQIAKNKAAELLPRAGLHSKIDG
jgi:thiamine pyrophosphate-dependent acetolactate synthase large subunit-like protein